MNTENTKDTTYNGWTNYETWCVSLWLDNDYGLYEMMNEAAQEYRHNAYGFEQWIRDLVEESNPLASEASMFSDLMNAALSEVNWREIAENHIDDLPPEEDEDTEEDEPLAFDPFTDEWPVSELRGARFAFLCDRLDLG